jgi:hypothetical protein
MILKLIPFSSPSITLKIILTPPPNSKNSHSRTPDLSIQKIAPNKIYGFCVFSGKTWRTILCG